MRNILAPARTLDQTCSDSYRTECGGFLLDAVCVCLSFAGEELNMQTVEEFLAYTIHLEREAATRFGQLADAMESCGNREVGKLFRRLADYSRLHLADAQARSGFREIPVMKTGDLVWPGLESPETAAIWAADPLIGREQALEIALDAETAGLEYYKNILDATDDPEIKALAKEFVAEESGHVAELQKWIAAHKAGQALPVDH
jgi:rubrerythrin